MQYSLLNDDRLACAALARVGEDPLQVVKAFVDEQAAAVLRDNVVLALVLVLVVALEPVAGIVLVGL